MNKIIIKVTDQNFQQEDTNFLANRIKPYICNI